MIAIDLCQANYPILLITCLEFLIKNVYNVRKEKKSKCDFIGFRNNRSNYRCKECEETWKKSINEAIKNFPNLYRFCNGDLGKFCCC